jgi:CheY-like chemotaxis protein
MLDMNKAISVIMHEIKSPLNAILGIVEMAKIKGSSNNYLEYMDQIKNISIYMLAMSNFLLDSYKENSNLDSQLKQSFKLRELIEEVMDIFRCQITVKNIDFNLEYDEGVDVELVGEILKIKQILINILANAVKFTANQGNIELLVQTFPTTDKLKVSFLIRDNGIGMNKQFLKRIYQPFAQENAHAFKGTGLGLMIVHQYIQQLNGTIDVKSKKGVGSEFYVTLEFDYYETNKEKQNDFSSKRVLLVDDSMINLEVVSFILKETGAEVEVASNGKIAFDKFVETEVDYYDLILMDMRMPVLDGCSATKAIRALERKDAKEINIIAFSSNSLDEDVNEALASGMNDFIYKPIEAKKLYKVLHKYL